MRVGMVGWCYGSRQPACRPAPRAPLSLVEAGAPGATLRLCVSGWRDCGFGCHRSCAGSSCPPSITCGSLDEKEKKGGIDHFDSNDDKMKRMVPVSMPKAPTSSGVSSPPPAAGSQAAYGPIGLPPVAGLVRTRQCLVQASTGSAYETSPAGTPQAVDVADSSMRCPRWSAGSLGEPSNYIGSPEDSVLATGLQL